MKALRIFLPVFLALSFFSCKKDSSPYIQIKTIENLIYQEVHEYRVDEGEDGPFVHQYFIVGEAQAYSYRMATGLVDVNTSGIDMHWDNLNEKYSFYNQDAVVWKTPSHDAETIVQEILEEPTNVESILGDLTQCGVGVEADTAGYYFITILLAKAD